jgi:hypothetical protein
MKVVSFRLDDERAKKLNDLLIKLGIITDNKTDAFKELIDRLAKLDADTQNTKTLIESESNGGVDIACPLRFKADKIVRDVDPATGKTYFKHSLLCFCHQFERGKTKKPLELINPLEMCKRCVILKKAWLDAQPEPAEPEAETPPPTLRPLPQILNTPTQKATALTIMTDTTNPIIRCERKHTDLHYTRCLTTCKTTTPPVYFACRTANPEIAKTLDHFIARDSQEKKS